MKVVTGAQEPEPNAGRVVALGLVAEVARLRVEVKALRALLREAQGRIEHGTLCPWDYSTRCTCNARELEARITAALDSPRGDTQ